MRLFRNICLLQATLVISCSAEPEEAPFRIAGAKMEPVFDGDTPTGLRFSEILGGSCISGLGIRDGDVLVAVQDLPVTSIHDYVRFIDALNDTSPFSFQVRGEEGEARAMEAVGCGLSPSDDAV